MNAIQKACTDLILRNNVRHRYGKFVLRYLHVNKTFNSFAQARAYVEMQVERINACSNHAEVA